MVYFVIKDLSSIERICYNNLNSKLMAEDDEMIDNGSSDGASDGQRASVLRQQKQQARRQEEEKEQRRQDRPARAVKAAGTATKASGRAVQAGGAATEYSGKAAKYAGKGIQAGGRAVSKGGQAITKAGGELSSTGLGAIIGVPLAIVGAGVTGLGLGAQAAGKGVEAGGEAAEKGGKAARQAGKNINKLGSDIKDRAGQMQSSGPLSSFRGKKHKDKGRSLLGEAGRSLADDTDMPNFARKIVSKTVNLVATPIRMGTDWALRMAWTNLISSWGLTLIYINIHVFFRFVLGTDFFCKLGHEWTPGGGLGKTATITTSITTKSGKTSSTIEKGMEKFEGPIGVVEAMGLIGLDLLVLFIILIVATLIAYIVGIAEYPLEFAGGIIGL